MFSNTSPSKTKVITEISTMSLKMKNPEYILYNYD